MAEHGAFSRIYNPYQQDFSKYGFGPEHNFFSDTYQQSTPINPGSSTVSSPPGSPATPRPTLASLSSTSTLLPYVDNSPSSPAPADPNAGFDNHGNPTPDLGDVDLGKAIADFASNPMSVVSPALSAISSLTANENLANIEGVPLSIALQPYAEVESMTRPYAEAVSMMSFGGFGSAEAEAAAGDAAASGPTGSGGHGIGSNSADVGVSSTSGSGQGADGDGGDSGASSGGTGGPATCFLPDTLIQMADGSSSQIKNINIGDKVSDTEGGVNTVVGKKQTTLGSRKMASVNGADVYMSSDHPILTTDGWCSAKPIPENFPFQVAELTTDHTVMTIRGAQRVESISIEDADPETELYDLTLDGNHQYYANGQVVHNCYEGGRVTRATMTGPDPRGPDSGYIQIQPGEHVISRPSTDRLNKDFPGLLDWMNQYGALR
jgi:hypothetical protein